MDYAIQEEFEALSNPNLPETQPRPADQSTLNKDFQEAYKAISSSPWGAKLGGFFGTVVKQGGSVYSEAQKELSAVGEEASKGLTDLRSTLPSLLSRTRALSVSQAAGSSATEPMDKPSTESKEVNTDGEGPDSEGVLARLRSEAAKRLTEIQKAEDAADEALLKFGTNIRNFLRDAVTIAAPSTDPANKSDVVMFESKDAQGKRVIHTTRFDAQLHVIHSTLDSFLTDPANEEYESWAQDFNVDSKTDYISKDLEKHEELRSAMEKLVPDRVAYADFWKRYYYLRHSIETAEARRRDLLKGASVDAEEEVGWDDSDDEAHETSKSKVTSGRPASVDSSTTINPGKSSAATLRPVEPRKSHDEKSQADSESSYDVVNGASGVPSQAPSSPKENKKGDESEEEDWE